MIKVAVLSAFFSLFLEYCMTEGNIFHRYYLYLTYWWIKWHKRKSLRMVIKPLGLCSYCFGSWICLFLGLFYGKLSLIDSVLTLGLNFAIIDLWKRFE